MKKIAGILIALLGIAFTVFGIAPKVNRGIAVTVIGGQDGPTSIFLAGNIGTDMFKVSIVIGIFLIVIGSICIFVKRK